jgi:hypothetical protein
MQMRSINTYILRHIHKENGALMCRAYWVISGNSGDKPKEHIPPWLSIKPQDTHNNYLPASKYWYYNKVARRNLLSEMKLFTPRFILTLHNSHTAGIIYITEFFSLQNWVLHNRWHHMSLCSNSWSLRYDTQSHIRGIIYCYWQGLYILKAVHPVHHIQ